MPLSQEAKAKMREWRNTCASPIQFIAQLSDGPGAFVCQPFGEARR
jgi:hypothetical protein